MACARLDADLADAGRSGRPRVELAPEAVEVGAQVLDRRVRLADLADLAADGDRHALGLEPPDQRGDLGRDRIVDPLLEVHARLREVDEGRAVDVDVEVAGGHRVTAGPADVIGHRLGVGGVLLGVELVVVALNEDRAAPSGSDRPGEDVRGILEHPLEGVGLLGAGELQDHRPDRLPAGGGEDRPRHVEGLGAQVDSGNREPRDLAAAAGRVELLNARGRAPELLARLPDQPPRGLDRRRVRREGLGPG